MKRLGVLALVALVASDAGARSGHCRGRGGQRDCGDSSMATFEAFPSGGTGTSGVCSTTAPTGSRGETATGSRASSATCQSTAAGGLSMTGIGNSDFTTLLTDVVRVEYSRDGVLGARIESAGVNQQIQSEALNNAAYSDSASGAAAPTLNGANAAVAPDGTTTADDYTFAATIASQSSGRISAASIAACTGAACTYSVLVKGQAGSGTDDVCVYGGAVGQCGSCAFVSTSWTRCVLANTTSAGQANTFVGNNTLWNGGTLRASNRVYVWGLQAELGAIARSYTPTAGTTVTRAADVLSFPVTLAGGTFSAAASYDAPSALVSGATAFQIFKDSNNSVTASVSAAGKLTCTFRIGGSDSTVTTTAGLTASAVNRVACTYGASGRSACIGGTCDTTAGALTLFTGASSFYVGTRSATGNEANGIISRLCYDPADARCI